MDFYLGTHQPAWLTKAAVPLFVSHRRLVGRTRLPRAATSWALDSGGFSELSLHGEWQTDPAEYVYWSTATTARSAAWAGPRPRTGCANRSCSPRPA